MIEKIEEIWEKIDQIRKFSDEPFEYDSIELDGIKEGSVLIGIDKEGRRGILLKDKSVHSQLPKPGCTRIEISREIVISDKVSNPYIKIICADDALENSFSLLIYRLIKLISDGSTPTKATIDVVYEFRRLLSKSGGPLPSDEEILGLVG